MLVAFYGIWKIWSKGYIFLILSGIFVSVKFLIHFPLLMFRFKVFLFLRSLDFLFFNVFSNLTKFVVYGYFFIFYETISFSEMNCFILSSLLSRILVLLRNARVVLVIIMLINFSLKFITRVINLSF